MQAEVSFKFKRFSVSDTSCAMKIGTDGVLLGAWADVPHDCEADVPRILDAGCGSGLISLMLAQRLDGKAAIVAADIDDGACADCAVNVDASPWPDAITVIKQDMLSYDADLTFDAIVCNPPFFDNGLLSSDMARAQARHGECTGFTPLAVVDLAGRCLARDGALSIITPCDCYDALLYHAEMSRLKLRRLCCVSTVAGHSPSRLLWELRHVDGHCERTMLAIRNADGSYTDTYKDLTKNFYLNF